MSIYGRIRSWNLVMKCMNTRPSPVLVVTGTRYSGKSAFLGDVAEGLAASGVPHAKLDFAGASAVPLRVALDALVLEFTRHGGRYRRLRFDRYLLARKVMRTDFGTADPAEIRKQMRGILSRQWHRQELADLIGALGNTVERSFPNAHAAEMVGALRFILLAAAWLPAWATPQRPGAKWFRKQDPGHRASEDVLTRLYLSAADDDAALSLLMEAFLADVRADHRRGNCAVNYAVLLDNVDDAEDTGQPLVRWFAEPRTPPVPLTVVATSREPSVDAVAPVAEWTTDQAEANFATRQPSAWLPVRLPDLAESDVHDMVRAAESVPYSLALGRDLHAFTAGHAGAIADLLAAAGKHQVSDLRLLLRMRSANTGLTVLTELLEHLIGDLNAFPALEDDLTVCAAARDRGEAVTLASSRGLPDVRVAAIVRPELWVRGPENSHWVLPTALRRALLERLRDRDPDQANGWNTVFGQLRTMAAERHDLDGELYHELAGGNPAEVVRRLARMLDDDPAHHGMATDVWLELLANVTTAPNRLGADGAEPVAPQAVVAGVRHEPDKVSQIAVLVGRCWVAADPLADGRAAARDEIGAAIESVARTYSHRYEVLHDASRAHGAPRVGTRDEPPSAIGLPRPSPRPVVVLCVVAVVLSGILGAGVWWRAVHYCGTLSDGSAYPIVGVGDRSECTGVTGSLAFRPEFADAMKKLERENDYATRGGSGTYVTLALAGPLSLDDPRMLHRIEGAIAAIHEANLPERATPRVRLVLANMDSAESSWEPVTDELIEMRGGDDHLVAVAGIGLSQQETQDAITKLNHKDIPVIGDMLTADTIKNVGDQPKLFRIGPTTRAQVERLRDYYRLRWAHWKAVTVRYWKWNDLYTRALAHEFRKYLHEPLTRGSLQDLGFGPGSNFKVISDSICSTNINAIFYAGRAQDLPTFIHNLGTSVCDKGNGKKISVISTSDTSRISAGDDAETKTARDVLRGKAPNGTPYRKVELIYTPLAEPSALTPHPDKTHQPGTDDYCVTGKNVRTTAFTGFRCQFQKDGFNPAHLATGWAITEYDAVTAAAWAVHSSAGNSNTLPEPSRVMEHLGNLHGQAAGAADGITFGSDGNQQIRGPIPILRFNPDGDPVRIDG